VILGDTLPQLLTVREGRSANFRLAHAAVTPVSND